MAVFTGPRAFIAITFGQFVSLVGSGMTRFGLGIWVLRETGDTTAYTAMLFFAILPVGLGSIFTGTLIDRWNRRIVMLAGNTVASLSTLVAALLYFGGALEIWHLYIVLTVNGLANAFVMPSMEASVPLLVRRENLGRASGLTQMVTSLEVIIAPAISGVLIVSVGLGIIFVVDFVTFGASVIALAMSVIPQPARDPGRGRGSLLGEFIFGLRYIAERPPFVYLMVFFAISMFLMPGIGYALSTPLALVFADERAAGLIQSSFRRRGDGLGAAADCVGRSQAPHGRIAGGGCAGRTGERCDRAAREHNSHGDWGLLHWRDFHVHVRAEQGDMAGEGCS